MRPHRIAMPIVLLLLGAAVLAIACSNDVSRRDVVASLTELVIVPQHEAAADSARVLDARIQELVDQPAAGHLAQARGAWREARSAWSRIQAYSFGPIMDRRIPSLVDWWPIDTEKIGEALGRPSISAEDVRERFAASQRGFGALEYLLFTDDETVLGALESGIIAYGPYLLAISGVISEALEQAASDWRGAYGDEFAGRSDRAVAESLAIADLVRAPVFLTETVGDMQLGVALGITKPEANPTVIPGGNSDQALDDLEQNIRGIQNTYLGGDEGLGLSDLIAQLSEETDQRMRDTLTDAIEAIDALKRRNQPLKQLTQSDPDAVSEVRDAIKAMQIVLNTEVVSLLGVSIGFSDNDGDS